MQIHELNTFSGTPTNTDYLAIDNGTKTSKIGATGLGVTTQMTTTEATAGTSTASRVITPKVLHDYVGATIPAAMTAAEATAGTSTATRVISPKVLSDFVLSQVSIDDFFESAQLSNVTDAYAEANILQFKGLALNPNRYPVTGFIIVADATGLTTTGSAIWICRQSSAGTTDTKDVLLASVGSIYPTIGRTTTTASAYLKWSGSRTAGMRYSVYRFY